jgi:uncharacterized protein with GYD domain
LPRAARYVGKFADKSKVSHGASATNAAACILEVARRRPYAAATAINRGSRRAAAMRYVLLGSLGPAWATRHDERVAQAKAKLDTLGIRLEAVYYTQGEVDFVDVVEAPSAEAMLAFSVWYVEQGYGRFRSLPAFDDAAMRKALATI